MPKDYLNDNEIYWMKWKEIQDNQLNAGLAISTLYREINQVKETTALKEAKVLLCRLEEKLSEHNEILRKEFKRLDHEPN